MVAKQAKTLFLEIVVSEKVPEIGGRIDHIFDVFWQKSEKIQEKWTFLMIKITLPPDKTKTVIFEKSVSALKSKLSDTVFHKK